LANGLIKDALNELKTEGKTIVSVTDIVLKTGIDGEIVEEVLETLSTEPEVKEG